MIKIPYEAIIEKIKEKAPISDSEIKSRIDEKLKQLSGLISREGAAHIVANELGINLFQQPVGGIKIKDVLTGMRDLEVFGKVQQVFDVTEFNTEKRKGKVGSFFIADETGSMRVVLWNEQAEKLTRIKAGDVVRVQGAYVKDNNSRIEAHLGERGNLLVNPKGIEINNIKSFTANRKNIEELKGPEENVEIFGTIVQVFSPNFFEICPSCGKRTKQKENAFYCEEHGEIEPDYSYVLNIFLDDGTENIRAVFFRNQAERLLKKNSEEILAYKNDPDSFEQIKTELLGNQVKLIGRAVKNEMFNRVEFITQLVFEADPEEEIKRLKAEKGS